MAFQKPEVAILDYKIMSDIDFRFSGIIPVSEITTIGVIKTFFPALHSFPRIGNRHLKFYAASITKFQLMGIVLKFRRHSSGFPSFMKSGDHHLRL